jgi:hypothetical protein
MPQLGARGLLATVSAALLLAACQNTEPRPPVGKTVTAGDWTVTTRGRVSVESGYAN